MIGLPEIIVIVVIVLIFVGYRRLPQIGRATGEAVRSLIDRVRGMSGSARQKIDENVDPRAVGRSAGRAVREARETRDAFTGKSPADESDATKER